MQEPQDRIQVGAEIESNGYRTALQKGSERRDPTPAEQVKRFRESGLASAPGRRKLLAPGNGPCVMSIAPAQQRSLLAGDDALLDLLAGAGEMRP